MLLFMAIVLVCTPVWIVFLSGFFYHITKINNYAQSFIFTISNNAALQTLPESVLYVHKMTQSMVCIFSSLAINTTLLTFSANKMHGSIPNLCFF